MLYGLMDFDPEKVESIQQWALWHATDHQEIRQAIQRDTGINLTDWTLLPFELRHWDEWSSRHQQAHNDMTQLAGVIGSDLTAVNLTEPDQRLNWHFKHFYEHYSLRFQLGI